MFIIWRNGSFLNYMMRFLKSKYNQLNGLCVGWIVYVSFDWIPEFDEGITVLGEAWKHNTQTFLFGIVCFPSVDSSRTVGLAVV